MCLQVGNAAYHNDILYENLRRCIPQLTKLLLSVEEDKTKANAAGALSNLVRNSNSLCEDIISQGALQVCGLRTYSTSAGIIYMKRLKILLDVILVFFLLLYMPLINYFE